MFLIAYSQKPMVNMPPIIANKLIEEHPSLWLSKALDEYPEADTILLFALEI